MLGARVKKYHFLGPFAFKNGEKNVKFLPTPSTNKRDPMLGVGSDYSWNSNCFGGVRKVVLIVPDENAIAANSSNTHFTNTTASNSSSNAILPSESTSTSTEESESFLSFLFGTADGGNTLTGEDIKKTTDANDSKNSNTKNSYDKEEQLSLAKKTEIQCEGGLTPIQYLFQRTFFHKKNTIWYILISAISNIYQDIVRKVMRKRVLKNECYFFGF